MSVHHLDNAKGKLHLTEGEVKGGGVEEREKG